MYVDDVYNDLDGGSVDDSSVASGVNMDDDDDGQYVGGDDGTDMYDGDGGAAGYTRGIRDMQVMVIMVMRCALLVVTGMRVPTVVASICIAIFIMSMRMVMMTDVM